MAARRESAARRYAEAAFEVAVRDEHRRDLAIRTRHGRCHRRGRRRRAGPRQPGDGRSRAGRRWSIRSSGRIVSVPVLNLVRLMLHARADRATAARRGRVPPPRQRPPGDHPATATTAVPLSEDEIRALVARLEQMTGAQIELESAGRSQPAGWPDGPRRRSPDRRERPRPPGAAAQPARLRRLLGDPPHGYPLRRDHQHHQVRDRPVRLGCRDPQRRDRRRGRRRHRPDLRTRRRAVVGDARVPERGHGHGPQPRGGDRRRGHPGRVDRRSRKATRSRPPGASSRCPSARPCSAGSWIRSDARSTTKARSRRPRPGRSSGSPRASSSASRSTRRSRPASRPSMR